SDATQQVLSLQNSPLNPSPDWAIQFEQGGAGREHAQRWGGCWMHCTKGSGRRNHPTRTAKKGLFRGAHDEHPFFRMEEKGLCPLATCELPEAGLCSKRHLLGSRIPLSPAWGCRFRVTTRVVDYEDCLGNLAAELAIYAEERMIE